jgi:hypothetical protein
MRRVILGVLFDAVIAGGLIGVIVSAAMWATSGR